jgi:hypothetical protein
MSALILGPLGMLLLFAALVALQRYAPQAEQEADTGAACCGGRCRKTFEPSHHEDVP